MTLRKARKIAIEFCKEHRIELLLDWYQCPPDQGAYADSTIWTGKIKDPSLFCMVFCHEVGHCIDDRSLLSRRECMKGSRLSGELTAWAHVPELMYRIFGIKLDDSVAGFIGQNISTYQYPATVDKRK